MENEYGSYGNDMAYKEQIRDIIFEHVQTNALLYTADFRDLNSIRGGAVPGALTTINFGPGTRNFVFMFTKSPYCPTRGSHSKLIKK